MSKRKSSGQAGPSRGNNKPRLTSSSVADVESSDKSLKKEAEEKRKERFNKYTTRKWNSLDKGGASTSSDVNQTGGNSEVDKDKIIEDYRRKLETFEAEKAKEKEEKDSNKNYWEGIKEFKYLQNEKRYFVAGFNIKNEPIEWWNKCLEQHHVNDMDMDTYTTILPNILNHAPSGFPDTPQTTSLKSRGTYNLALREVVGPVLICKEMSPNELQTYYKDSVKNFVLLNQEEKIQIAMDKIFEILEIEAFQEDLEDSKTEDTYAYRVNHSVYRITKLLSNRIFGTKCSQHNHVKFHSILVTKKYPIKIYPDLDILSIEYTPKSTGQSKAGDTKAGDKNTKSIAVMVGEVKKPSIKPVLNQLRSWAEKNSVVNLNKYQYDEDENLVCRAIISQLLCYMIVGKSRNGLLADSQSYIFTKLEPNPEKTSDATKEQPMVLKFYEAPANTKYKDSMLPLSPRAAILGMIGSIVLYDLDRYYEETIRLFSSLTNWAQNYYINLFFSEKAGKDYYDDYYSEYVATQKFKKIEFCESFNENIKIELLLKSEFVLYHGKNFNSFVIKIPYLNLPECLTRSVHQKHSHEPDFVAAKVFDVSFLVIVRGERRLEELRKDMLKLYWKEINIYKAIHEFNRVYGNHINIPTIYGTGFISVWNKEKDVSELGHHVAVGPAILMEVLRKERPRTNEQFKSGLSQLAWLHVARIAHEDVKLENLFYTNNKFIFIDFGKSEVIPYTSPLSSPNTTISTISTITTIDANHEASQSDFELSQTDFNDLPVEYKEDLVTFIKVWHKTVKKPTAKKDIKDAYVRFYDGQKAEIGTQR